MIDENPTEAKLIAEYLRLRSESEDETVLEVGIVTWSLPYAPELTWQPFRTWPTLPTPAEVADAHAAALADRMLFRRCRVCGERFCAGHMHNASTCQGCAERTLGIVY